MKNQAVLFALLLLPLTTISRVQASTFNTVDCSQDGYTDRLRITIDSKTERFVVKIEEPFRNNNEDGEDETLGEGSIEAGVERQGKYLVYSLLYDDSGRVGYLKAIDDHGFAQVISHFYYNGKDYSDLGIFCDFQSL